MKIEIFGKDCYKIFINKEYIKGGSMKKYPIIYQGEKYEVRWDTFGILNYISIYKETPFSAFCFTPIPLQ